MFLGNVDIAVVNVAIPSIRDRLHASGGELRELWPEITDAVEAPWGARRPNGERPGQSRARCHGVINGTHGA
ncbi:hypothetical protein [Streptomyces sp. NPDC002573]|uniref:hypothetical protein n=1 Tax=Streptomyces sp. NPDC002573 TaxID=3364651 RepID=UPI0036C53CFC